MNRSIDGKKSGEIIEKFYELEPGPGDRGGRPPVMKI